MRSMKRIVLTALLALFVATAHAQCNSNPIAVDDDAEAAWAPILINVLANDSEPDGEALTVSVTGNTCLATHEVVLDLIRLTPTPSIPADCTLTYRIEDESGNQSFAVVNIDPDALAPLFTDGFENGTSNQWFETCSGSGC